MCWHVYDVNICASYATLRVCPAYTPSQYFCDLGARYTPSGVHTTSSGVKAVRA
jgi:hypothetical protein